uniref:U1 small nuclear ribonucleoprotein C n=1 Tax=Lates calcarifer TaxID=8187 RepID=A0A4W6D8D4_LATCA
MPKFYCDYCDTYLTHDSPSVRKTHCSGRKHKENVKDYYQKWMEEQAQSLIDKTTAAFQQGKIPPTPFPGGPPPGGPPRPGMLPTPPMGGPPMMPMMGPPPHGMMPGGPGGMRPPMGGPMQMMPGPPHMMRHPRPMMMPGQAGHDASRQIRTSGFSPFFVAMNRYSLVRTLSLTLWFICVTF